MANISLTLYTNGFIGSVLKSPTQMGSLSINNSVTNISRLGTFKCNIRGDKLVVHHDPVVAAVGAVVASVAARGRPAQQPKKGGKKGDGGKSHPPPSRGV